MTKEEGMTNVWGRVEGVLREHRVVPKGVQRLHCPRTLTHALFHFTVFSLLSLPHTQKSKSKVGRESESDAKTAE